MPATNNDYKIDWCSTLYGLKHLLPWIIIIIISSYEYNFESSSQQSSAQTLGFSTWQILRDLFVEDPLTSDQTM